MPCLFEGKLSPGGTNKIDLSKATFYILTKALLVCWYVCAVDLSPKRMRSSHTKAMYMYTEPTAEKTIGNGILALQIATSGDEDMFSQEKLSKNRIRLFS